MAECDQNRDRLNKLAIAALGSLGRLFREFAKLKDHVAEFQETEEDLEPPGARVVFDWDKWSQATPGKTTASSDLQRAKDSLRNARCQKGGELAMPVFMRVKAAEFDKEDLIRMLAIAVDHLSEQRKAHLAWELSSLDSCR